MTNRQPIGTGFHPQQLPTLQPGTMRLVFAEQFQVLHDVKVGGPYACAMEWPDGWQSWDPGDVRVGDYADVAMGCGVAQCANPDSIGGRSASGMLRAWPEQNITRDRAWKLFARVSLAGMQPGNANEQPLSPGEDEMFSLLLISGEDLLGADPDGKFFTAGLQTTAGYVVAWDDNTSIAEAVPMGAVAPAIYVQLEIEYDADDDVTQVTPSVSGDGIGFLKPNTGEWNGPWLFAGPPRVFGLACARSVNLDVGTQTSEMGARLDYVAVFAADELEVTASEGGRNYY